MVTGTGFHPSQYLVRKVLKKLTFSFTELPIYDIVTGTDFHPSQFITHKVFLKLTFPLSLNCPPTYLDTRKA